MKFRRYLLWAVLILGLLAAAAWMFRAPIALRIAERGALARLSANPVKDLPDGLHVGICGAGSPFPDQRRSGPCTLVLAGQRLFVFDAGSGSSRNVGNLGFLQGYIEAIFLTHFHSDHIDGLGELMLQRWVSTGNSRPVDVYGPAGVETVLAGFMQAYGQDRHYRVAHHGDATVPAGGFGGVARPFEARAGATTVVLKDADLEVSAFVVDHAPVHPAVGYKIVYKGRSVVISGDTKQSAEVLKAARGADLLLHEALSPTLVAVFGRGAEGAGRANLKKVFADILDYHATPEQAAQTAQQAGVGYLMFNHIVPALPLAALEKAFVGTAGDIFKGPMRVALDGDFVSLPAGSKAIEVSRKW